MKKIDEWLTRHGLKNRLTLVVVIAFILFLILLFMFLNHSDEDSGQITITENAELRTGPNAAYPVIYKIEKRRQLQKVDKKVNGLKFKIVLELKRLGCRLAYEFEYSSR